MFGGYVLAVPRAPTTTRTCAGARACRSRMAALAATRLFSAGGAGGLVLQAWALRRAGPRGARGRRPHGHLHRPPVPRLHAGRGDRSATACTSASSTGAAPFAITFVPADAGAGGDGRSACRWASSRPTCRSASTHGPAAQRLAQLPASASAGIRDGAAAAAPRPTARVAGAIAFWAFQIAVLWASLRRVRRRAAARGARRRLLRRHARQPAAAAGRHRRRRRRDDRRLRGLRRRLRASPSSPS